jgi:hypothetical protein
LHQNAFHIFAFPKSTTLKNNISAEVQLRDSRGISHTPSNIAAQVSQP